MVTLADGTVVNRAAVVVLDGRAEVAVLGARRDHTDGGNVQVVAAMEDVTVETQTRREAVLRSSSGEAWTVGVGDGCGCRSNLSQWYANQIKGQPMGT